MGLFHVYLGLDTPPQVGETGSMKLYHDTLIYQLTNIGCRVTHKGRDSFTVFPPKLPEGLRRLVYEQIIELVVEWYPRIHTSQGPDDIEFYYHG